MVSHNTTDINMHNQHVLEIAKLALMRNVQDLFIIFKSIGLFFQQYFGHFDQVVMGKNFGHFFVSFVLCKKHRLLPMQQTHGTNLPTYHLFHLIYLFISNDTPPLLSNVLFISLFPFKQFPHLNAYDHYDFDTIMRRWNNWWFIWWIEREFVQRRNITMHNLHNCLLNNLSINNVILC